MSVAHHVHQDADNVSYKGSGEFGLSYGRISGTQIVNAFGNSGDLHYTSSSSSGNIFATYHYYLTDQLCLGVSMGTQSLHYHWKNDGNGMYTYQEQLRLNTAALELKAILMSDPSGQAYTLLGIAETNLTGHYTGVLPGQAPALNNGLRWNIQYSFGYRFGKIFGGFVELGIGYKGLINGGLYYTLPKSRKVKSVGSE